MLSLINCKKLDAAGVVPDVNNKEKRTHRITTKKVGLVQGAFFLLRLAANMRLYVLYSPTRLRPAPQISIITPPSTQLFYLPYHWFANATRSLTIFILTDPSAIGTEEAKGSSCAGKPLMFLLGSCIFYSALITKIRQIFCHPSKKIQEVVNIVRSL